MTRDRFFLANCRNSAFYTSAKINISIIGSIGQRWCNATWDGVMCWPAIPANTSFSLRCPPMKGIDTEKFVTKYCHESGYWDVKEGMVIGDPERPFGWTNYKSCFTPEWIRLIEDLNDDATIKRAQDIARIARYLEFIGLSLSFLALIISLGIFACIRRLRVFRNQLHIQLKIAILLITVIRLILYIDGAFTQRLGNLQTTDIGLTINTSKYICEVFYILLEYAKTVAAAWAILEGFFLHNSIVFSVFGGEPNLAHYCLVGWGIPAAHTCIWLAVLYGTRGTQGVQRCLGPYYLNPEIWVLDSIRLFELALNFCFLLNIIRVLWRKVRETNQSTFTDSSYRKSIKAALMLMPLLGIPNILQLIPLHPTKDNIFWFAVYTYVATFFYMYQGLCISLLYCFTNKEVREALKTSWTRYRLTHSTGYMLRRESRYCLKENGWTKNGGIKQQDSPSPANDPRRRSVCTLSGNPSPYSCSTQLNTTNRSSLDASSRMLFSSPKDRYAVKPSSPADTISPVGAADEFAEDIMPQDLMEVKPPSSWLSQKKPKQRFPPYSPLPSQSSIGGLGLDSPVYGVEPASYETSYGVCRENQSPSEVRPLMQTETVTDL